MERTLTERTDNNGTRLFEQYPNGEGRHALTENAWHRVRGFLPRRARRGRPPRDSRTLLEGVLWVLATGAPWRDLPSRFGPWQTTYGRFRSWVAAGIVDRIMAKLQRLATATGVLDDELWCVDSTVVRASRSAAGACSEGSGSRSEPTDHALGRSRGGFGTKLSLVCTSRGHPLAAHVAPGQQHDLKAFEAVMDASRRISTPRRLAADKAYSTPWVRHWLRQRRIQPVIPTRSDQPVEHDFDRRAYRKRNVIERLVGWLKESRRVATRFDKLAIHYLAFVRLAMALRLLKTLEAF